MTAFLSDCMQEFFKRKIALVFAAVNVVTLLLTLLVRFIRIEINGQIMDSSSLGDAVTSPMLSGFATFMDVLVFIAVMMTAGLIPGMLAKGRAEFYLAAPLARATVFRNKVTAIWILYGSAVVASLLLNFVVAAVAIGFFGAGVLYIAVIGVLNLLVWLSLTSFVGAVTGSAAIAIVGAFGIWMAQVMLGARHALKMLTESKVVIYAADALYYILPKNREMSTMAKNLATGMPVDWLPLYSSLLFAAALLWATCVLVTRKDF